jgi:hypothetical protein
MVHYQGWQDPVAAAIRARNVEAVSAFLSRPHESVLLYGCEDLGVWSIEAYEGPERRTAYALTVTSSCSAWRARWGGLAVANPEAPDRAIAVPDRPLLLERIEGVLGISITPPDPYRFYYGLETDRGTLGERVLNALYCAWRVRQLTADMSAPRILEIGAGLGRLADYSHRMALTDYWIVDIPMTSLVQGHFRACALGEDRIVLDGESSAHSRTDAVKILNPKSFFADDQLQFDIIVNSDSLSELGKDVATSYFRLAAERSLILFSVNHEVNPFRVFQLHQELDVFGSVDRRPYWMRHGYVEEIFRRSRRDTSGRGALK